MASRLLGLMSASFSEAAVDSTALGRGGALQWPEAARELARVTARAGSDGAGGNGGRPRLLVADRARMDSRRVPFWVWWLRQAGGGTPFLFWAQTVTLLYLTTILPTFFFYYVRRMRQPASLPPATGLRVAMITLCVPGHESLEVIRAQLETMRRSLTRTTAGCSTRAPRWRSARSPRGLASTTSRAQGVARWNQPGPPFQETTKAGNVNAWLDHVGRAGIDYEVFVQLDIDHQPRPDYLDRVLWYFRDP